MKTKDFNRHQLEEDYKKLSGIINKGAFVFYLLTFFSVAYVFGVMFINKMGDPTPGSTLVWTVKTFGVVLCPWIVYNLYPFNSPVIYGPTALNFIVITFFSSIYLILGNVARKQKGWSFIVGILLYVLDSLFFLQTNFSHHEASQEILILRLGFNLFILIFMFRGLWANVKIRQLKEMQALYGIEDMEGNTGV
ncbi:MAG: hypothetical protein ACLFQV_10335 [Vulcanimicrobiota bacterium]